MTTKLVVLALALALLPSCAIRRRVNAYQALATAACEKRNSVEACKPLPYPTSVTTGRGSQ